MDFLLDIEKLKKQELVATGEGGGKMGEKR